MIDFNNFDDDLIIICPSLKKEKLIKIASEKYPLKHIKYIDKAEVLENTYFNYDYSAILYLHKQYNFSFPIAKEILDNLTSLEGNNEKINKLNKIYLDLKSNKLLQENLFYKHLFNNKKIYIYGYSKNDVELMNALEKLNVTYEYIYDEKDNFTHNVYKFKTMEDEVKSFFIKIMDLLENNISLNNIYLYSFPNEYEIMVNKYARYHNIKIEGLNKASLFASPIYKKYLEHLKNNSIINAFELLSSEIKNDPQNAIEKLANVLVELTPLYNECNEEFISLLNFTAKSTILSEVKYDNSIKICDYNSVISDDSYVFILGFSLDAYPNIYRDTDFYSDKEKEYLGKNTSKTKNIIEEEMLTNFINNTKNIYISYKERYGKKEYYPSLLINKLKMNIFDGDISNIRYSLKLSEIEISDCFDKNKLYGIDNKNIKTFDKDLIGYQSYSHEFSGLNHFNNNLIKLSPTSISEYNTCPFKYYANRVLKIGEFENTFALKLGNIFHLILQDSLIKEINLDNYRDEIEKEFTTFKEKTLLYNLLPQVLEVINKNKEFYNNSHFKNACAEKEITINVDDNSLLTGKIDKVIFNDNDKELIVVDYKTGNFYYDKRKNAYGIDLQLPIYSLLLNSEFNDYTNVGMYIQNVCLSKKELMDKDVNPYYLNGLTLKDDNAVKRIDHYLGDYDCDGNLIKKSRFIQSIKIKNDKNLDAYSGIVQKEYDALKEVAKGAINETLSNVRNNVFSIAPIRFKGQRELPCKYCDYNDVCFMKYSDVRYINFNGGDDDETI